MWKRTLRIAAVLIALMAGAPASAQEWTVFFPPGDGAIPPAGYARAREAAAWMSEGRPGHAILTVVAYQGADEAGTGLSAQRAAAMELELARQGVWEGRIQVGPSVPDETDARPRVVISGQRSDRPYAPGGYIDQMLVYFGAGSVEIPEGSKRLLLLYVAGYRPGEQRVLIYGHADTAGSAEENRRLSEDRTEAVGRFLARNGVRWEDICMTGKGETQLARATRDGVSEPLNRRVLVDVRDSDARC